LEGLRLRIDAHQHYWNIDRGDYDWISPINRVLYRNFLPDDLLPHLHKHNLDRTILVQAAPTLEETEYLLSLSETSDTIGGVVGWLNLHDPAYKDHFKKFSEHPKFAGFRIMIQEMPDPYVLLQKHFVEALTYFAERDVPVDLLVLSSQLDALAKLLARVPGLRGVIDHLAKPRIKEGEEVEPWKSAMREFAKHPKLYCKLSGMVTEADHQHWKPSDFTFYVRHVIEVFGPGRVMFGSDWPVCLLAADYDRMMAVLLQALPDSYTEVEKAQLFGGNAERFYKLNGAGL
jgi:L-fuconolactonase